MKWDVKHDRAKKVLNHFLDNAGYRTETESLTEGLTEEEIQEVSAVAKLTAEQIENLAKEIREFLLEHGLWQDVDIYFNGKKYTSYDPENGEYYYNDREHLIEVADQPERHFEYVNPEHILSMSFEGPVCEMLYYGILPSVRKEFDKIFERYGLYYEFGHHWNFSCYYI